MLPRWIFIFPLLLIATPAICDGGSTTDRPRSDCNIHFVDFFQESEGMDTLFLSMNENNIGHAMICGTPLMKIWEEHAPKRPRYSQGDDARLYWYSATDVLVAREVLAQEESRRDRLHPFICGFNPSDRFAVAHVERMLDWYPGLWQGIGEVFTRHDELSALTYGQTARADNKAMHRIYDLAEKHDLPVLLHSNATSVFESKLIYVEELERVLKRHPGTRFIWAHAGTSMAINRRRHLDRLLPELERLLSEFENLWIDLSWSVLDEYLLLEDGSPNPDWLALMEKHPDRFMIGSDALGKFESMGRKIAGFDPVLDALAPETADMIARANFLGVLPGGGFSLDQ